MSLFVLLKNSSYLKCLGVFFPIKLKALFLNLLIITNNYQEFFFEKLLASPPQKLLYDEKFETSHLNLM